MKLDVTVMKSMTPQDYRVLSAVEYGMKTHELVPVSIITSLAKLRHGGTQKILSSLLRDQLLSHDQSCGYDGYRVTIAGQDILALHSLKVSYHVHALGRKIGTGKESDVYLAIASSTSKHKKSSSSSSTVGSRRSSTSRMTIMEEEGIQVVAKFHRLGRTSFRNVKKKRDYFFVYKNSSRNPSSSSSTPNSWLFLSTLSAKKEFAFMQALHTVGLPTPIPIAYNRHVVVMSLIRGMPLYQILPSMISSIQAKSIFEQSIDMTIRLLSHGLIHCDLNEYNLLVDLSGIQQQIANSGLDKDEEEDVQHDRTDTVTLTSKSRITNTTTKRHLHSGSSIGEYYVRHSGKSMAGKGALSVHGPMTGHSTIDGTGERITEEPPKPKQVLNEQGEAKPVVTLIDFPQMISINHPNARELFERDVEGLRRFFGTKLNCPSMTLQEFLKEEKEMDGQEETQQQQDESLCEAVIIPSWDDLVQEGNKGEMLYQPSVDVVSILGMSIANSEDKTNHAENMAGQSVENASHEEEGDQKSIISAQTLSRVTKRQLRIDQLLKVSGFSQDDAARDSELYYFQDTVNVIEEEEEEEVDESSEDDNRVEEVEDEKNVIEIKGDCDVNDDSYDLDCADDCDDKNGSIKDEGNIVDDNVSVDFSAMTLEQKEALFTSEIEAKAKIRVMRHVQSLKKRDMKKGAFASRNSNKTFVKGKRIFHDYGQE